MVEHKCEKCGKIFKRSDVYKKHLKRKTPCDGGLTELDKLKEKNKEIEQKLERLEQKLERLEQLINSKDNIILED